MNKKQLEEIVRDLSLKIDAIKNIFGDNENNIKELHELVESNQSHMNKEVQDVYSKLTNIDCEIKTKLDKDFKLIHEYNKAFSFIIWFDFNKLYSYKLRKEAKEKLYSELDIKKSFNTYKPSTITIDGCGDLSYTKSYIDNTLYCAIDKSFDTVKVGKNIEIICSEKEEESKVKYEDTVAYVLSKPFEFNEGVIIAVANYLKDIMKRDNEYRKYAN